MAIAASYPALRPSLLLDFANSKTVDSRVTFTRSTTAKYYDGVTTAKAEENLLLQSQTFDNAAYWQTASNVTISADTVAAPNGTTTAETMTEAATTATHRISANNNNGTSIPVNQTVTLSCYYKKGTRDWAVLSVTNSTGSSACQAWFDLTNGVVGTVNNIGIGSGATASIVESPVGSGWYRCVLSGNPGVLTGNYYSFLGMADADGSVTYLGDVTKYLYLWGAQLEARSQVTAYTPTTTQPITNYIPVLQTAAAGVPRIDHNPVTGECLGLLIEEQRTNLLPWSESFRSQTLSVTGVSGTFVDGETVTATGGGTGTYVLAESTGSSFAIFNGSGTFTGTLTGGTSGATATISSSVANWAVFASSITANTIVAPDGTLTGDKFIPNATNVQHAVNAGGAFASAAYTTSVYAKAGEYRYATVNRTSGGANFYAVTVDLQTGLVTQESVANNTSYNTTVTNAGNGWWRIATYGSATSGNFVFITGHNNATYTPASFGMPSFTGDGYSGIYIWGAQLEAGAFPTSYIPTVATQETRNADAASMTGTNFSSWFNNGEGTLYGEGYNGLSGKLQTLFTVSDGTTSNRIQSLPCAGVYAALVQANNTIQFSANPSATADPVKVALAYQVNNFALSLNGAAPLTDPLGIVPVVNQLRIGALSSTQEFWCGTIKKLAYYPQRLTNANLQALTA